MSSLPPIKRMKIDSQEKSEENTNESVVKAIKAEKENREPTGNHKKPVKPAEKPILESPEKSLSKSPEKPLEKSTEKPIENLPETKNSSKSFRNKIKASTIDLSKIYGKPFPAEIQKFWKSCKKSSPITPCRSQKGWTLVGPFHVLSSKIQFKSQLEACMYSAFKIFGPTTSIWSFL